MESEVHISAVAITPAQEVAKISDDVEKLLAFYDCPAERWAHLPTTNPIESALVTVRHRTKITRGPARGPRAWPCRSS